MCFLYTDDIGSVAYKERFVKIVIYAIFIIMVIFPLEKAFADFH